MPEEDWRKGRAAVLRSFLERPSIYQTAGYAALEKPARENLERKLNALAPVA